MKVIAINGSPHKNGNTYTALKQVCDVLEAEDIHTEIVTIGDKAIAGCKSCGVCAKTGSCIYNDGVGELVAKMREADGILIGSPVYYSGINGTVKSFLDRAFYMSAGAFRFKPCSAVVALRRSGATLALQTINQYFMFAEMLITPSVYWNGVHGGAPGEAAQDTEGMQIMRSVGANMAYLLKLRERSTLPLPQKEEKIKLNYIR